MNEADQVLADSTETDPHRPPEADEVPGSVVALSFDYPPGHEVPTHRHRRSQFVYAARGVVTARSGKGSWVLPTARGLWVPRGTGHSLRATGQVQLRTVYFDPSDLDASFSGCMVVSVNGLLRELILRAVETGPTLRIGSTPVGSPALVELLIEELRRAHEDPHEALHLPDATDPRLRRLTEALREDPSDPSTLGEWGRRVGASERTLARLFLAETALTFGRWRQLLRLQRSLELLAAGHTVSRVALDVGYESLSAFISMFHRATGHTPSSYFASKEGDG